MSDLLDDQPAGLGGDRLRFQRYVQTLEELVVRRQSSKVLVTAIYGAWGSGKSTLLRQLAERLKALNERAMEGHLHVQQAGWLGGVAELRARFGGKSPDQVKRELELFKIVEFSPWLYRNEKSLMVPLLATLAKRHTAFRELVGDIIHAGPGFARNAVDTAGKLAVAGTELAVTGLPLLTFLADLNTRAKLRDADKGPIKELTEKIDAAVRRTVSGNQRIVFLIDDIDRCHDPTQVVGLLEQLKLLLHLDRCLFFIAADRQQIVAAIDKLFPGAGRNYLEKFVQVGVELAPHAADGLMEMVPWPLEPKDRAYFKRLATVVGNPRRFKQLLNQTALLERLVAEHLQTALGVAHTANLVLAAKCVVLRELTPLCGADGRATYLKFEAGPRDDAARIAFYGAVSAQPGTVAPKEHGAADAIQALASALAPTRRRHTVAASARSAPLAIATLAQNALASFLWLDMPHHKFGSARLFALYAALDGEGQHDARQEMELAAAAGAATFESRFFGLEDLTDAELPGATFADCTFEGTQLQGANLANVAFERCNFHAPNLAQASIAGVRWQQCQGLATIEADIDTRQRLVAQWLSQSQPVASA